MLLGQVLKDDLHYLWVNLDCVDSNMDTKVVFNY